MATRNRAETNGAGIEKIEEEFSFRRLNLTSSCRICLQSGKEGEEMAAIFDQYADDVCLYEKIESCGGIKILTNPELPRKICKKCNGYLDIAHKFRLTCRNSDKYLRELVCKYPSNQSKSVDDDNDQHDTANNILESSKMVATRLKATAVTVGQQAGQNVDKTQNLIAYEEVAVKRMDEADNLVDPNLADHKDESDEVALLRITNNESKAQINDTHTCHISDDDDMDRHDTADSLGSELSKMASLRSKAVVATVGQQTGHNAIKTEDSMKYKEMADKTQKLIADEEVKRMDEDDNLVDLSAEEHKDESDGMAQINDTHRCHISDDDYKEFIDTADSLYSESSKMASTRSKTVMATVAQHAGHNAIKTEDSMKYKEIAEIWMDEDDIRADLIAEDHVDGSSWSPSQTHRQKQPVQQQTDGKKTERKKRKTTDGTAVVRTASNDSKAQTSDTYICHICCHMYRGKCAKYSLEAHMKQLHSDEPLACKICSMTFITKYCLKRHIYKHTGMGPYSCQYCERRFADRALLLGHERKHRNKLPFKCETCGKNFKYERAAKKHMLRHTAETRFSIGQQAVHNVDKTQNLIANEEDHKDESDGVAVLRITSNESKAQINDTHTCHISDDNDKFIDTVDSLDSESAKMASTRSKVVGHEEVAVIRMDQSPFQAHQEKQPVQQQTDGKNTERRRRETTKAQTSDTYICHICCHMYQGKYAKYSLEAHMKKCHSDEPYACKICSMTFITKYSLKRHMYKHHGMGPYSCQYCERHFTERSILLEHERNHRNERPYTCKTCGKSFINARDVNEHMLTHTGEKRFYCGICYKGFKQSQHLTGHLKSQIHRDDPLAKLLLEKRKRRNRGEQKKEANE